MYWKYRPEWCAWWLMIRSGGTTDERGFGPFNATEAKWAAEVHGIPLYASVLAEGEAK